MATKKATKKVKKTRKTREAKAEVKKTKKGNGKKAEAKKQRGKAKAATRQKWFEKHPLEDEEIELINSGEWNDAAEAHSERTGLKMSRSLVLVRRHLSGVVKEVNALRQELRAEGN